MKNTQLPVPGAFPDPETTEVLDLSRCVLCPRECKADRAAGERGFCGFDAHLYAARAGLHRYEEPCISVGPGSGTVFFDGCNLGCVFCQNAAIAHRPGPESAFRVSPGRLAGIFLELEAQGAANINLVTAGHFLPLLLPALEESRKKGLSIPFVYNSSGYEKAAALRALDGLIDVYLPDVKFYSPELSKNYANAPDYFETAEKAVEEMVRQQPVPVFEPGSGRLLKGVIVRHLILPGHTKDSIALLTALYERFGNRILYSLMNQYTPIMETEAVRNDPLLSRSLTKREFRRVLDAALDLGIENGYFQEGGTVSESFIPAFDGTGILSRTEGNSFPESNNLV